MKKKTLLPQITTPVERSTIASSKTQGGVLPSFETNPDFLLAKVAQYLSPFAGDDAE